MRNRFTCLSYAIFNCIKNHEKFRFGFFRFRKSFYWHAWSYIPEQNISREWIQFPAWFSPSNVSVSQLLYSMRPFTGYNHFFYGDRKSYKGKFINVKVNTLSCFLFLLVLIPVECITHLIWR